jgi:succinoglycan biosynthesis transport protein ExoP
MQELRRNITDEMRKIAEAYKSDYEIAQTREQSIRESLASAVSESQLTSKAQVQMRELESNAQTYRALYDNFLQRYMEAVQQQSFPITEARLISPASRPLKKSQPKTLIVLGITIAAGLMLSFGFALMREMTDRVFRTSQQIENILRVNCLAILAKLKNSTPPVRNGISDTSSTSARTLIRRDDLMWSVVDHPFARFTESIRAIKVAADLNGVLKSNKVIGITSALPNEGKSTVTTNLAQLIAHSGGRAILIDGDLRNPSLTRRLAMEGAPGIIDVLAGKAKLEAVLWTDPTTGLHFLPAGATARISHTTEIIRSDAFKQLIDSLKHSFDYVLVDLPPLAPVVDVRTTSHIVDSYVFVIEWGKTKIDVIEHNLAAAPGVYERLLGVVMNKADMNVLSRYEPYQSNYYYRKYYARYGYVD